MSNNIKNWFGISAIVAVLALAYGLVSFAGTFRYIAPAMNSVSVSGEGKVVAIPDIAQFSYSVINEGGKDIAKLQKDNTDKGNKIIAFLKTNDVEAKDIKTDSYNISPRYTTYNCYRTVDSSGAVKPCPPSEITGYTVSQSVSVKVRDFSKISDLLGGVANLGANNVSGLSFTVEDPDALKTVARDEAIEKARVKAQAMAKAGGFSLGRLLGVDEGGGRSYYDYAPMMSKAEVGFGGASAPSPTIEAGSQDIVVDVTLRYEIR
ncbi:MAG: SIMPL domain-containing protein [Candidatus Paceibacterota bacterium]|jgi:hypothetical protein